MSPLVYSCRLVYHRFGFFKIMSPFRFVAVQSFAVSVRLKWMSPLWFVAVSVCRRFSLSPFRFVAVLTHSPNNDIVEA